jgi:uracil-DNA glycosylase family 4
MNQFEQAVGQLRDFLREKQVSGQDLHCTRDSLERFRAALALRGGTEPTQPVPLAKVTQEIRETRRAEPALQPVPAAVQVAPVSSGLGVEERQKRLEALRETVSGCQKCAHLVAARTQVVFGVGDPCAELMFVGEAPGEDEDLQGEPFVGKAGQLLTKIIETMGFSRETIYIANVLKCRPDMPPGESGNRKPRAGEMATCLPYLREQIGVIQPRVLVALGATAMEGLIGETQPMARLRGRWHEFEGIPLMATYHPAYLLRNQSLGEKRKVWEDMLLVLERLGRVITEKQQGYFLSR